MLVDLLTLEHVKQENRAVARKTARCRSCSLLFKVRRQHSLQVKSSQASKGMQASELYTYRHKTEFNAKWPIRVIQGHMFWSQWKGDKGLSNTNTNVGLIR